ncbi:MAG: cytochrome c [Ignavibacteriae bacterium]|nr:cytochrome c [Ignavibacteriota bacterium]NOG99149.1 cytochrome c [Ignavibacteriota bacterium]
MDFLDKLVIPQSMEHIQLLKTMLIVTYIILLPYLGVLFGTVLFSVMYNSKGRRLNNPVYIKFSKNLIDVLTQNKSMAFGLGAVPMLSAIFCYAQLLHQSNVGVTENMIFALILFLAAVIAIYTYKYSFHLKDVLKLVEHNSKASNITDEKVVNDFKAYQNRTNKMLLKSGTYGLVLLALSLYIFVGSMQLANDSSRWGEGISIVSILFSSSTFIYFLFYISASFVLTSLCVIYLFFKHENDSVEQDAEYSSFVKNFSLKTALIFTGIQFILVAVSLFTLPDISLSYSVFGYTLISLSLLLVIINLVYFMIKESSLRFRNSALFLFLIFFVFIIIKDQYAFETSSQIQFKELAENYTVYEEDLKKEFGTFTESISGADIYNGRCIACHQYDKKVVGPPYNSVLPKYEGDLEALSSYILNPVKVNPEYPAMPNQGLKPNEAKAVAEYLMNTYKQ